MRCVSAMIPLDLPTANAKGRPIKVILSDRRVVIRVYTVGEEELLMFFGLGLLKPPRIPPNRRPQHFLPLGVNDAPRQPHPPALADLDDLRLGRHRVA